MFSFNDIRSIDFEPLSQVKARLSEYVRNLISGKRRIVITANGKPAAVLLSYADYMALLSVQTVSEGEKVSEEPKVIIWEDWKKDRKKRRQVRDSILQLFNMDTLSRKGQKAYKRESVRGFAQKTAR